MFNDYLERLKAPNMSYYHEVYKDSKRCEKAEELNGKTVTIYMEQGFGDQLQFLRFLPMIDARAKRMIVQASTELHRIIQAMGYECFAKDVSDLPDHDLHILSLSMPFVLKCEIPTKPYITIPEKTEIPSSKEPPKNTAMSIGIAWEGNPEHAHCAFRNCPLRHFKSLKGNLYCLQNAIHDPSLLVGAEDMNLNAVELTDFYDTAKLLNSLDLVVSVDTSVVHLAGAMGKKTIVLLAADHADHRWFYKWYDSVEIIRGDWDKVFNMITRG